MSGPRAGAYRPIACAAYSALEAHILRRQWLWVVWWEAGARRAAWVLPTDLETRDGGEYLLARDTGGGCLRLRLEGLESWTPGAD